MLCLSLQARAKTDSDIRPCPASIPKGHPEHGHPEGDETYRHEEHPYGEQRLVWVACHKRTSVD
jgi:hypothetical protein